MTSQEAEQQAVLAEPFLLGAKMVSGFELVSRITGLEKQIEQADVIITGEGRIDQQTIHGKVPYGVAVLAKNIENQ